jgi:hypothetical protein
LALSSDRSLTVLELISFPVGVVFGFLVCRWNVLPYVLGPVNDYLYLVARFLGIEELYSLVVQIYLWPLLELGHLVTLQLSRDSRGDSHLWEHTLCQLAQVRRWS